MSFVHSFWAYLHWFSYLFTWCTSCAYYIHNVPTKIMLSLYVFSWQSNFHKTMNNHIENKYWRIIITFISCKNLTQVSLGGLLDPYSSFTGWTPRSSEVWLNSQIINMHIWNEKQTKKSNGFSYTFTSILAKKPLF